MGSKLDTHSRGDGFTCQERPALGQESCWRADRRIDVRKAARDGVGWRNPSIRLTPLPTGTGITLQPFPQIRSGHRINVDADILGKKTRERLQASAFEIAVSVFSP